MPPAAVEYVRQPYVSSGRMSDLVRQRARNAAEAELRRGDIAAQMWGNVGNTISNTMGSIMRERQEAPLRAMELERQRRQLDAEDRLSRQDTAFMALLEQQPNPDPREVMAIYGPQRGMQIAQGLHAFTELQTGAVKDARETAGRLAIGLKSLSPQLQKQWWPAVRTAAIKGGLGDEQSIPQDFTPDFADAVIGWASGQAPAAPNLIQRDPTKDLVHPTTGEVVAPGTPEPEKVTYGQPVVAMVNGRRMYVRAGSDARTYSMNGQPIQGDVLPVVDAAADNEPLVSIVGDDGKPVLVRRRDAVGKTPATGSQKPATGLERRALNFFNRARQADLDLEALESDVLGLSLGGQTWMQYAPNFAQTELGQLYTQAQRAFTEARLRKDSGAAIPEQEFENDRKTYFVQPGDSEATIEQKRRGRAAVLASLGFESGQALGEYVGDPDEASRIVNEYRTRSARQQQNSGQTPNLSGLREGFEREIREGPFKGQVWTIVNGQGVRVR